MSGPAGPIEPPCPAWMTQALVQPAYGSWPHGIIGVQITAFVPHHEISNLPESLRDLAHQVLDVAAALKARGQ